MIHSNIFKPRNDWAVKTFNCKRYKHIPKIESILADVSNLTGIHFDALKSKDRNREIVEARFFYFYRARNLTKIPLRIIGDLVNRNHASVIHGVRMVDECREIKERYNELFNVN